MFETMLSIAVLRGDPMTRGTQREGPKGFGHSAILETHKRARARVPGIYRVHFAFHACA